MQVPFGKVLRLDVNVNKAPYYTIPDDNPFINRPDTLPEIWASGLRNPPGVLVSIKKPVISGWEM